MPPESAALPFPQHSQDMLDHTHPFSDFNFGYAALDDGTTVTIPDPHATDIFAAPHSAQDRQNSIASLPSGTPAFASVTATARRASLDTSEDGSDRSAAKGLSTLDDTMSDEFGLSTVGPGDGTDLGGKPGMKEGKSEAAPAWSELKTKAGKERKRLPLACIACRRKKIRCSGEKPACKHCLRSRIPCVYKVTTRKAAPRTDYMAMLDKRLKRMEERIIKVLPKSEQEGATSITRAVVKPAIPGTIPTKSSKKRGADEAFGAELDHWARGAAKTKPEGGIRPVSLREEEESKLLEEGKEALPPPDIQAHLAEVFFSNIYGQAYHILHKPNYMRKLEAGTLPPVLVLSVCAVSARFSTHPELSTLPCFQRGEEWATCARDIVIRQYDCPNMTILTCLLILGLHEFGTCQGGRSWALGGMATRMAFALQLHKDLEYDPSPRPNGPLLLSPTDREIRRRAMWACFLMDRFNSSGTDRPMFIREEVIKIPLPIRERYFQNDMPGTTETLHGDVLNPAKADEGELADPKANMGVAAYMIRSVALWGRIISYLSQGGRQNDPEPIWSDNSVYTKLVTEAKEMLSNLPESLQYSTENLKVYNTDQMANQYLFLHISLQQNILFLNRHVIADSTLVSNPDVPKSLVDDAHDAAFTAANRISDLLKEADSYFVSAPFVGYCAFCSSTVHIMGLYTKGRGDASLADKQSKNLGTNIKFLHKMRRYWGIFHWMVENLRNQYKAYVDATRASPAGTLAASADNSAAATAAQSPIFYSDWFDRYPHGVSHSDFVDPATHKKKEKGDDAVLEQKAKLQTVEEYITTLSPPRSAEARDTTRPGIKRKPTLPGPQQGAKKSQREGSIPHLDPLMTDLSEQQHLHVAQQHLHGRSGQFPLGGQTSGPTTFNPLTMPHTATGNGYHALSPVSPIVSHHSTFPPPPHSAHFGNYPPELLCALGVGPGANLGLHQMERQMVYNGYPGAGHSQGHHSAGILDAPSPSWDGLAHGRRNTTGSTGRQGSPGATGFVDSSAWFLPFNAEPPEIGGHDILGSAGSGNQNIDPFAAMFGMGTLRHGH